MNKIMNQPESFVDESLKGIVLAHGDMLKFSEENTRAVVRSDAPVQGKVAIVTGGGYGHLPVFLGYVGRGLCDGVAVGNVFTSPSCDAIVAAAKATNSGAGVLFLFGNYMGDSMNFDMASEMLDMEDIPCAIVKAADDVASAPRSDYKNRRGVGGIFFPYTMKTSEELAGILTEKLTEDLSLTSGDEVAVLVNSLGATSKEELYVLYADLYEKFQQKGIKIGRVYVGEYATSLEMLGASVSVLKLNDEFKTLLDDEAKTPFIRL